VAVGLEGEPPQLYQIEREEQEARLRLDAARARELQDDEGESPTADHALVERLEAEWKHALERLHLARGHHKD
jgi:hypothetical protein